AARESQDGRRRLHERHARTNHPARAVEGSDHLVRARAFGFGRKQSHDESRSEPAERRHQHEQPAPRRPGRLAGLAEQRVTRRRGGGDSRTSVTAAKRVASSSATKNADAASPQHTPTASPYATQRARRWAMPAPQPRSHAITRRNAGSVGRPVV